MVDRYLGLYLILFFSILETGCGKSTQLPLYLHEAGWTQENYSVVVTQPRRVAATTLATRVAAEIGSKVGEDVGFCIRFDYQCSDRTRIKFYTDGALLRETMSDPLLSQYSVVIVDEAHQRSLHSDILLGLLKKIQNRRKDDFRLIITSATLDAENLKQFFETNISLDHSKDTATILSIQGRLHPVDILYLTESCRNYLHQCVTTIFQIHQNEDFGDILVFLPGSEEIEQCLTVLNEKCQQELVLEQEAFNKNNTSRWHNSYGDLYFLPLYSSLPVHQQMQVFHPTPVRKRKVVLATNIAEASITIEGVRFVVDSGFVKLNYFDVRSGIDALITRPISKSVAIQRAGRAGRTEPGKCFRLMKEMDFLELEQHTHADMQRVDITWTVLQLKALGVHDILHFDFLSPPSTEAMIYALELLFSLNALDDSGNITSIGGKMAEMPLEPRMAKCLLSSLEYGCSEEIISIAAMCSVEYPFYNLKNRGSKNQEARQKLEQDLKHFRVVGSDHLTLLAIFREFQMSGFSQSWCDSFSLQYRLLLRAKEIHQNLLTLMKRFHQPSEGVFASAGDDDKVVRKCIVTGFFAHVASLHNDGVYRTLRGQVKVQPIVHSVVDKFGTLPEWVIFNDIIHSTQTYMREVTRIDPLWLYDIAPNYYNLKF